MDNNENSHCCLIYWHKTQSQDVVIWDYLGQDGANFQSRETKKLNSFRPIFYIKRLMLYG